MNTSLIAVLICFGLCIKIALTIAAIHYFQRPSSKGTLKQKRKGGQRTAATRKKKAVSTATTESSPKPIIKEPPVPSAAKPLKPAPAVNQKQAEPKTTGATAAVTETKRTEKPREEVPPVKPPEGARKMMKVVTGPPQQKGERIGVVDIRKKAQMKDTAPAQTPEQMGPSKEAAVSRTPVTGAPQNQAASTAPKSVEKPPLEPAVTNTNEGEIDKSSGNIEPEVTAEKEGEPVTGDSQESSEPPEEDKDSNETENDKGQKEKSGLGDLADLFATSASDFTEKSKLSEQVNEVDVNDILHEGLDLLGKVKKPEK
mgnify:CR=1 FL=1